MSERDNFPEWVRRVVAERAAYLCSFEGCRELTVMPSSNPEASLKTGRAAHIHAASKGGPRYDENQTPEQRKGIDNAIHMCARHADVIDKDDFPYPAETLQTWKRAHEAWVAQNDLIPAPPRVSVATAHGLLMGSGPGKVTGEMVALFRDHVMRIETGSRHELLDLELRIQFPEAVVEGRRLRGGGGPRVTIEREQLEWHASGGPGSSWEIVGAPGPTPIFVMRIESLRAGRPVDVALRCIPDDDHPDGDLFGPDAVHRYLEGKFLYRHRDQLFDRYWIDAFEIDADRRVTCRPITKPVQLIKQSRGW